MDDRELARRLAFGRIGIGASALFATKLFGLIFLGRQATEDPVVRMASRLFGIREISMGLATIDAANRGLSLRRFVQLGVIVDAVDCLSIFAGRKSLPWRGRLIGLGLAVGFATVGAKASLGEEPTPVEGNR
jgi:hypothetical protein